MNKQFYLALLAGVSAMASSVAAAQDVPPPAPQPTPATGSADATGAQNPADKPVADQTPVNAPAAQTAESPADIVVTGSRVVTNGNNAPTPVTVVSADQMLKLSGTTVTDSLNLLPALQGVFNGPSSRPGGSQRNGAGSYLTLRNMGNLRTLILYDGQRLIPTINQNEADVDSQIVPQLLIKRVDIVTGGVSAVYGSDAISGVVNFITDRDFNGVKVQAFDGISDYGDGRTYDIGVAAGTRFAGGRGHFEASYQYHKDNGILSRRETGRSFFDRRTSAGGNGCALPLGAAGCIPFFNYDNALMSNFTTGGLITNIAGNAVTGVTNSAGVGGLRDLMFTPQGTLTPFVHGLIPTATGLIQGTAVNASSNAIAAPLNWESGGSGVYNFRTSLKAAVQYHQAFGRFDYDLTDDVHAYAQLGWSKIHSYNNFQVPNIQNARISYANPFLDTAFSTANLAAVGITGTEVTAINALRTAALTSPSTTANTFQLNRFLDVRDPRANQWTNSYIFYAGLDGTLFDGGAKWDVNIGKSKSSIHTQNAAAVDNGRLFAALDAVRNSSGQIVCRASLTNANYSGCVPLNLLGEGQASPAALDYIFTKTDIWNRTRMEQASASISGAPFETWAGPVNMALSGEWRRLRWDTRSSAVPQDLADCVGIALNCVTQTATTTGTARWFFNTQGRVPVTTQKVGEVAYEVAVPLLKDVPLVQDFTVSGAVRFTHYDTSGSVVTWKAGGDWHLNDDLRIRATRSRDIRAPNVFELAINEQRNPGFNLGADPANNGITQVPTFVNVQRGNPNLDPEKADTLTIGAVATPTFIPRFSVSVDYYKIDVKDAIFLLQGFNQQVLRACALDPTLSYCSIITRSSTVPAGALIGPVTETLSTYLNIATLSTWGIDTEVNYKVPLLNGLTLRAIAAYQPKLTFDQGPAGVLEAAGAYNTGTNRLGASPKWKITGFASLDVNDNLTVSVMERWRSGLKATWDPSIQLQQPRLPSMAYTTLNLDWHFKNRFGDFGAYLNISNLFNKFPTVYYTANQTGITQGLPEGDDPVGRYYTVGFRAKF